MNLKILLSRSPDAVCASAGEKDRLSYVEPVSNENVAEKGKSEYLITFAGNSITRHGVNEKTILELGWTRECGMAASCEEKDYAHLLAEQIQKEMPEKRVRAVFGTPGSIWNPGCSEEYKECTDKDYDISAKKIREIQQQVCAKLNIPFASVSAYENDPANSGSGKVAAVRWHPNDNGMRCYADEALKAFKKLKSSAEFFSGRNLEEESYTEP